MVCTLFHISWLEDFPSNKRFKVNHKNVFWYYIIYKCKILNNAIEALTAIASNSSNLNTSSDKEASIVAMSC